MWQLSSLFAVAAALTLLVTPAVRWLSARWGVVDNPDGHRKLHQQPIPLGGGLAVFCGLAATLSLAAAFSVSMQTLLLEHRSALAALSISAALILVVGLIDDRFGMKGRHKLVGQLAAVLILLLLYPDLIVQRIEVFHYEIDLGVLGVPFAVFWLIAAINAVNLLDGMDGIATTVGILLSLTVAVMALVMGRIFPAAVAAALAGCLLGFLRFNFPPASMYLGDAGSMLIGLLIGTLAFTSSLKTHATLALAAPLAVWLIPFLDTSAAIVRRKLTGRSLYSTDRAHLHHRLFQRLGCRYRTLGLVASLSAVTCLGALVGQRLAADWIALASAAAVVSLLVASRLFGDTELALVMQKGRHLGSRQLGLPASRQPTSIRVQGSGRWDRLWNELRALADELNLCHLRFTVDIPSEHEVFHGAWHSSFHREDDELWHTELPLVVEQRRIGRLGVSGAFDGTPVSKRLDQIAELLSNYRTDCGEFTAIQAPLQPVPPAAVSHVPVAGPH